MTNKTEESKDAQTQGSDHYPRQDSEFVRFRWQGRRGATYFVAFIVPHTQEEQDGANLDEKYQGKKQNFVRVQLTAPRRHKLPP